MIGPCLYLDFEFAGGPEDAALNVLKAAIDNAPFASLLLKAASAITIDPQMARPHRLGHHRGHGDIVVPEWNAVHVGARPRRST